MNKFLNLVRRFTSRHCNHKFYLYAKTLRVQHEQDRCARCQLCGKDLNITVFVQDFADPESLNQLCAKRVYANKKDAETMMNYCNKDRRDKKVTKVYRCEKCKGWHLTSN